MDSRPLSILMIHPHDLWYDPWTIRILALARGLQARGHHVTLCHLPRKDRPSHSPLRKSLPDDPPIHELRPRQVHMVPNFRLVHRLARACDLIHVQKCFAAAALPALWASRLAGKPLHYDWDDNETALARLVEPRRFSRWQIAMYEKFFPRFAATITCSSQALMERAAAMGYPRERIWHLPVGADASFFQTPANPNREALREFGLHADRLTVLYIGQMEGAAHAHLLIEAAPMVLQRFPETQFLIVGGGKQLESMRALSRGSPAVERLALPGYVEQQRIPAIIACADICVACFEDDEATRAKSPLKMAEYLAAGKPIVASNVGEAAHMLQNCGILVSAGSAEALAEGILAYVHNPERRLQDGKKARERAEREFTWDRGVETLWAAYRCALGESPEG